jgi:sodium transport system permease protein
MNFRQIKLVYFKEMKDILRDKRTVRLMVLVPVVFYPLMSIGLSSVAIKMARTQGAKVAQVLMVGQAPGLHDAMQAADDQVNVLSHSEFAQSVRALDPSEHAAAVRMIDAWSADPVAGLADSARREFYYASIRGKVIDCIVEVPPSLDVYGTGADSAQIAIYFDEQEFRSDAAERKVRRLLLGWRDSLSVALLGDAGIEPSRAAHLLKPFWVNSDNVAPAEKQSGFLLAMMLPYMIVLMVMLGAMYPAIDLTAGEKERGTLETILASPAGRLEIAAGKFLCVFTAALVTVLLGALSMTLTSSFGFANLNDSATQSAARLALNPASLGVVVLMMVPTAVLFSAALLALAVMARSYKEAQSYVSPLMFIVIIPSMVAFMPGIELNAAWAWVPVSNIALAVRSALLTTKGEGFAWPLYGMVFLSTSVYASFALFIVRQMFNKESVLFRT